MDIKIDDMLKAGLLKDERMGSNALGLVTCTNAKATEMGLVKPEIPTEMGTGFVTTPAWPFPQFFNFGTSKIAINSNALGQYTGTVAEVSAYSQSLGVQYLNSSTFAAATGWVLGTGWTISGGQVHKAVGAGTLSQLVGSYSSAADTKLVIVVLDVTAMAAGGTAYVTMGGSTSNTVSLRKGKNVFYVKPVNASAGFVLNVETDAVFSATSLLASAMTIDATADANGHYTYVRAGQSFVAGSRDKVFISHPAMGSWNTGFTYTNQVTAGLRFASVVNSRPVMVCNNSQTITDAIREAVKTSNPGEWALNNSMTLPILVGRRLSADADFPILEELALTGYPLYVYDMLLSYIKDSLRKRSMTLVYHSIANIYHTMAFNGKLLVFSSTDGVFTLEWSEGEDETIYTKVEQVSTVSIHTSCLPVIYHGRVLYISADESLYEVADGFQVRELGYRHVLSTLTGSNYMMCYRSDEDEVMISDGTRGFIFNEKLTAVTQFYPSVIEYNLGVVAKNYGTASETVVVTSDIDIRSKGDAVLAAIHPAYRGLIKFRCRVHYKPDHSDTWRQTEWIYKFSKGFVIPMVMATDVRVEFRYEYESGVTNAGLYGATLEFQQRGRRNSRREFY